VFLARICYGFVVRDVLHTLWPKSELADNTVVVILIVGTHSPQSFVKGYRSVELHIKHGGSRLKQGL
jgi:hypothetical protein